MSFLGQIAGACSRIHSNAIQTMENSWTCSLAKRSGAGLGYLAAPGIMGLASKALLTTMFPTQSAAITVAQYMVTVLSAKDVAPKISKAMGSVSAYGTAVALDYKDHLVEDYYWRSAQREPQKDSFSFRMDRELDALLVEKNKAKRD